MRRLQEELGFDTPLQYIYKFEYQVPYLDIGAEHELCWVFVGRSTETVKANENEVASWRFISGVDLENEMQQKPQQFTPWFKMEWQRLKEDYCNVLEELQVQLP